MPYTKRRWVVFVLQAIAAKITFRTDANSVLLLESSIRSAFVHVQLHVVFETDGAGSVRAGHDTGSTSDTHIMVNVDNTIASLISGACGTDLQARGVVAVHTAHCEKNTIIFMRIVIGFWLHIAPPACFWRHLIELSADFNAAFAPNALSQIDDHSPACHNHYR
jgi:hypothetical protein